MNQHLDAGSQLEDTIDDMHPAVGEFVAAVDALVDEHLTDDEVEGRLERLQQRTAQSTSAGRRSGAVRRRRAAPARP